MWEVFAKANLCSLTLLKFFFFFIMIIYPDCGYKLLGILWDLFRWKKKRKAQFSCNLQAVPHKYSRKLLRSQGNLWSVINQRATVSKTEQDPRQRPPQGGEERHSCQKGASDKETNRRTWHWVHPQNNAGSANLAQRNYWWSRSIMNPLSPPLNTQHSRKKQINPLFTLTAFDI